MAERKKDSRPRKPARKSATKTARKPAAKKPAAKPKKQPAKKRTRKKPRLDLSRLTISQAAELLKLPRAAVRDHVLAGAAGAPAPPLRAARLNVVTYTAWLIVQLREKKSRLGGANGA